MAILRSFTDEFVTADHDMSFLEPNASAQLRLKAAA
jgi:hypothetical protein